ncbi:MAG: GatB/YqeY domain-containing protein [Alphaproteobacteria bacterium]|nr:GatB/YqeY domain-containing protein [Alphaproteobacteria bacterium]
MGLRDDINAALKEAMKAGDKRRISTLRLMNSAIKDKDINSRTEGHDSALTPDSGLVDLFAKMVKQRQESIAVYEQGNRADLAQQEREEIAIIQSYMPKQLSDDEAKAAVAAIIKEVAAASVKDMGKVMATLKAKYAGQMDMAKAGGIVKSLLGN